MKTYCSGAGCLEKTNRIPCIFALQRFRFWPDRWAVASPFRWSHWKLWNDHLERTSNGTWLVETSIFFSGKSFSIRYGDIFAGYFGICQPWNWQKLWCTEISGTFIHLPYCDLDEGHEWFCWFYPHLMCAHWYFPWVKKKHVEFYVHTHTVTYICICIYIYIHVYATHTHILYYILYTIHIHMTYECHHLDWIPRCGISQGPCGLTRRMQPRKVEVFHDGFDPSMNQSSPYS